MRAALSLSRARGLAGSRRIATRRTMSGSSSPLRALKAAQDELADARLAASKAEATVKDREQRLSSAQLAVEAARRSALISVSPRKLITAYALWLLLPFVWPGAYLFYLGRDTHAWLHTVSFGGFGIGWALDFFYIPLYVKDHNEPNGYLESVEQRHSRWMSFFGTVLAPGRLTLQLLLGLYCGLIGGYLIPRPLTVPAELAQLLGIAPPPPLSKANSAAVGFCVGMFTAALFVALASARLGRTRTTVRSRPVLVWSAICSAMLAPNIMDIDIGPDDLQHAPGLVLGTVGVMIGAASGRKTTFERSPRRCTARPLSLRLIVQLVGVSAFAAAALGSFHLNGSFTYTDSETGKPTTLQGPEALRTAWKHLGEFSGEFKSVMQGLWLRHKDQSWSEVLKEMRDTFRDPSYEAAEVLGISASASLDEIKSAYRQLARQHRTRPPPEAPYTQPAFPWIGLLTKFVCSDAWQTQTRWSLRSRRRPSSSWRGLIGQRRCCLSADEVVSEGLQHTPTCDGCEQGQPGVRMT